MSLFSTGNSLLCSQLTSNFANMCQLLGNFFALLRKGAALCSLRSTKMNKVSIVSYSVICLGGGGLTHVLDTQIYLKVKELNCLDLGSFAQILFAKQNTELEMGIWGLKPSRIFIIH